MNVYTSGSVTIRAMVKDCSGTAVLPADVSAIKLNIFEYLTPQTPVEAYTNVTIPTSAMLSTSLTDAHDNEYNFEYNPHDGTHPMFPKRQTSYVVELVFFDSAGKPSAHQMQVDAQ